jgi:hypothetical protein
MEARDVVRADRQYCKKAQAILSKEGDLKEFE